MNIKQLVVSGVLLAGLSVGVAGQNRNTDYTQWRGANRDGAAAAFTAPATWPEKLTQKWKVEIGTGYASPLIVGDRLYLFSRQGEDEVMSALESATGKVIWRTPYPI